MVKTMKIKIDSIKAELMLRREIYSVNEYMANIANEVISFKEKEDIVSINNGTKKEFIDFLCQYLDEKSDYDYEKSICGYDSEFIKTVFIENSSFNVIPTSHYINIHYEKETKDNLYLTDVYESAGSIFLSGFKKKNDLLLPKLVYSQKYYIHPAVLLGDNTLCNITPKSVSEYNHIASQMYGKVLIVGAKMGYSAYVISKNKKVESIDIFDFEEWFCDIVRKNIMRYINKPLKFLHTIDDITDGKYDCILFDLWAENNALRYLSAKYQFRDYYISKLFFYNEDDLQRLISNGILDIFSEYVFEENIEKPHNISSHNWEILRERIYDKIHNIEVNNSKELLYYLNPELTVRNLLKIKTKF